MRRWFLWSASITTCCGCGPNYERDRSLLAEHCQTRSPHRQASWASHPGGIGACTKHLSSRAAGEGSRRVEMPRFLAFALNDRRRFAVNNKPTRTDGNIGGAMPAKPCDVLSIG